jgi:hypothetical protein
LGFAAGVVTDFAVDFVVDLAAGFAARDAAFFWVAMRHSCHLFDNADRSAG